MSVHRIPTDPTPWILTRSHPLRFVCLRCDASETLPTPISPSAQTAGMRLFRDGHRDCPTWEVRYGADLSETERERMIWRAIEIPRLYPRRAESDE